MKQGFFSKKYVSVSNNEGQGRSGKVKDTHIFVGYTHNIHRFRVDSKEERRGGKEAEKVLELAKNSKKPEKKLKPNKQKEKNREIGGVINKTARF